MLPAQSISHPHEQARSLKPEGFGFRLCISLLEYHFGTIICLEHYDVCPNTSTSAIVCVCIGTPTLCAHQHIQHFLGLPGQCGTRSSACPRSSQLGHDVHFIKVSLTFKAWGAILARLCSHGTPIQSTSLCRLSTILVTLVFGVDLRTSKWLHSRMLTAIQQLLPVSPRIVHVCPR